jgi:DNA-binding NarL/FixJ family response regulator
LKVAKRTAGAPSVPVATSGQITAVVIDDQQLIRSAVRQALTAPGILVVGEAATIEVGVQTVLELRPDVVLMEFVFRHGRAIEAIEQIALLAPESRVLVLTTSRERECLMEAIVAGACGYLLKDARLETIVDAVRASAAGESVISSEVAGGLLARIRERDTRRTARGMNAAAAIRASLTKRELEIFKRLSSGETNLEIGRALHLSENTVKNHVGSILAKLHLDNRVQAAVHAVRSGLSCAAGIVPLRALFDESDLTREVVGLLFGG